MNTLKFIINIYCMNCKRDIQLLLTEKQLKNWQAYWQCSCGATISHYDENSKKYIAKKMI